MQSRLPKEPEVVKFFVCRTHPRNGWFDKDGNRIDTRLNLNNFTDDLQELIKVQSESQVIAVTHDASLTLINLTNLDDQYYFTDCTKWNFKFSFIFEIIIKLEDLKQHATLSRFATLSKHEYSRSDHKDFCQLIKINNISKVCIGAMPLIQLKDLGGIPNPYFWMTLEQKERKKAFLTGVKYGKGEIKKEHDALKPKLSNSVYFFYKHPLSDFHNLTKKIFSFLDTPAVPTKEQKPASDVPIESSVQNNRSR